MTLYITKDYYFNIFKGKEIVRTVDIEKNLKLAQEKIDSITFNRIRKIGFDNLTDFQKEKISEAICLQAEYIYKNGYNNEENSDIASYSVLDISVSVNNTQKNTIAYKNNTSERAYDLIHQTGLDSRING